MRHLRRTRAAGPSRALAWIPVAVLLLLVHTAAAQEFLTEIPQATYPSGVLPADWGDPSTYHAAIQRGDLSLVVRGYEGLALLRVSGEHSRQVSTFGEGLDIVGVRWAGDSALVRTARGEVLLLDVTEPAFPQVSLLVPPTAEESGDEGLLQHSASQVPLPPTPVSGRVVEVRGGALIVDQGADAGLREGMHLAVESVQPVVAVDIESGEKVTRASGAVVAVVEVHEVSPSRARAWLGPGDDARVGDFVRTTGGPITADQGTPRRTSAVLTVSAAVRPMLGIESLSFGAINDLRVDYRFRAPLRLGFALAPLAMDVGRDGFGFPGGAVVTADLDADFFAAGTGVGYNWSRFLDRGVVFRQSARFGSLDGVHLAGFNEFVLATPNDDESAGPLRDEATFIWGGFHAMFRFPTAARSRVAIDGRYGTNGHAYVLLDLHIALTGRGGPGTVWLKAGGGVGWIWDIPRVFREDPYNEVDGGWWEPGPAQVGPVFSFGVEWIAPVPAQRPALDGV
jgi:hypothetical protein